jgi:glycosyltransferase involved in cell wall biosynthesis
VCWKNLNSEFDSFATLQPCLFPTFCIGFLTLSFPPSVNWFRAPGQGWTKRYNYVVGIVHTNYDQYATQHYSGLWTAPAIRLMSAAMIRAYCHKVIKLSDVVQVFAPEKEVTMNVHGVREEFIATPDTQPIFLDTPLQMMDHNHSETFAPVSMYFIGKLLWTKGLDLLLEYEEYYRQVTGDYFPVEIYGSGPDQEEMIRAYRGRWWKQQNNDQEVNNNVKDGKDRSSRNVFVRLFAWVNSRRGMRKKLQQQQQQRKFMASSEGMYNDVMEVIESIPEKVRESLESLPSQARESFDQLSEDVTNAKKTMKRLPAKARRVWNQWVQDLSTTPIPKSLYELRKQPIPAGFPGRVDHAELKNRHKIFVNPSVSEVLCTTTAEALAMNKFAIIPLHPSNQFFLQFPNCLAYRNPYEFVANVQWALTHEPIPLSEDLARQFTWEAATDRFLQSAAITHREAQEREKLGRSKMDERIAWFHNELGKGAKGDILRNILGAGPVANQVKYLTTTTQQDLSREDDGEMEGDEFDEEGEEEEQEEDEGLSRKFHDSAFVKAIREAFENGISTAIE